MARQTNPVRRWVRGQIAALPPGDAMTIDATGQLDAAADAFRKAVDHECHALFGRGGYSVRLLAATRAYVARLPSR